MTRVTTSQPDEGRPAGAPAGASIVVNGETVNCTSRALDEVLQELGYGGVTVATAVNGNFVPASQRADVTLAPGDHVEVVAPRQGG